MTRTVIDLNEYNDLFYVLGLAFVDIRMTDDIEKAQILADIFHNVPAKISHGYPISAIMEEINEKAERHNYERKIAAMFNASRKNLSR